MDGSPLYARGGASSSRPTLDLNEPPALEPEPEHANRTSSHQRDEEAIPDLNKRAIELEVEHIRLNKKKT